MSICVRELHFSYRDRPVLNGLDFAHERGVLCVLGPNGVGKSTLFRCLLGLNRPDSGQVLLDGEPVAALNARARAQRVAFVPQAQNGIFGYTVEEMVLMGASARSDWFMPGRRARAAAAEALERLGILHLARRNFMQISGGERQLTLIARALAQGSGNLVLDEPCANLDYGNQLRVMGQVAELGRAGLCVALSTHQPDHALWYGQKVLALLDGRAAAFGPPEIIDERLLSALYGAKVCVREFEGGKRVTLPQNI